MASPLARNSSLYFVVRDAEVHRFRPLAAPIVLAQSLIIALGYYRDACIAQAAKGAGRRARPRSRRKNQVYTVSGAQFRSRSGTLEPVMFGTKPVCQQRRSSAAGEQERCEASEEIEIRTKPACMPGFRCVGIQLFVWRIGGICDDRMVAARTFLVPHICVSKVTQFDNVTREDQHIGGLYVLVCALVAV